MPAAAAIAAASGGLRPAVAVRALDRGARALLFRRELDTVAWRARPARARRSFRPSPGPPARARTPPRGRGRTAARAALRAESLQTAAGPMVLGQRADDRVLQPRRRSPGTPGRRRRAPPAPPSPARRRASRAPRGSTPTRDTIAASDSPACAGIVNHHRGRALLRRGAIVSGRIEQQRLHALERGPAPDRASAAGAGRESARRRSWSAANRRAGCSGRRARAPRALRGAAARTACEPPAIAGMARSLKRTDDGDAAEDLGGALMETHAGAVLERLGAGSTSTTASASRVSSNAPGVTSACPRCRSLDLDARQIDRGALTGERFGLRAGRGPARPRTLTRRVPGRRHQLVVDPRAGPRPACR